MPKFPLPILVLTSCLLAPLNAGALELSDLHLPMSRSEADSSLTKDYSYTVLEDMTVRRQWRLSNRVVTVDFSPRQGDEALLIYIDYRSPVTAAACDRDAAMLLGGSATGWKRLNEKRARHLGMEKAEGLKIEGGRYCFRELDAQGHITRLAYYAGVPKDVRWNLAADEHDDGTTAMGNRSDSNKGFLWKDEARRKGGASAAAATSAGQQASDGKHGDSSSSGPVVVKVEAAPVIARPEEPVDVVETLRGYLDKLTPTHYAIGGGVLLLLLLMRFVRQYREDKRREAIADYIMNRGQIPTGRKPHKKG